MSKWRKSKKPQAGDEEMKATHQTLLGGGVVEDDSDRRTTVIMGKAENDARRFCDNAVTTSKYSLFPLSMHFILYKNLFEQFHKAANVYFLAVAITQMIPGLSPTGRFTTLVPLLLVLFISLVKDAWEDWKRRVSDRTLNTKSALVYRGRAWTKVEWKHVAVGDVCLVTKGEPFPADLLMLWSSEVEGMCYIETASLDGETNLKPRKTPAAVYSLFKTAPLDPEFSVPTNVENVTGSKVVSELPNNRLYNFDGYLERSDGSKLLPRVPLVSDNVLLRGAVLRNTHSILGCVIFTGSDTKLMRNSINKYHKRSDMDRVTNRQIFLVFTFQIALSIICSIGFSIYAYEYTDHWYLGYDEDFSVARISAVAWLTFMILLNSLIPISLYVMLEVVRLIQAVLISVDVDMYCADRDMPAVARSSKLNEELGQVAYVFSDKTGTLTCNKMEFRQFSCFDVETTGNGTMECYGTMHSKDSTGASHFDDHRIIRGAWRNQRNKEQIRHLLQAMAVCHTVIPERDSTGRIVYQASSPDEACLVRAAKALGVELRDRNDVSMTIIDGLEETKWEILNVIEFSSNRKRMSIVVRDPLGRLMLLIKGADNVIFDRLRKDQALNTVYSKTRNVLDSFAEDGLRTLVFAKLDLSHEMYKRWKRRYDSACTAITERVEKIEAAAEDIEKDLELIGTTAIEDRLQDEVPQTIELLGKAGIKVWVLTGDKQETAINIGYACALLRPEMGLFKFDDCTQANIAFALEKYLTDVEAAAVESGQEIGLVIEGSMLHWILPTKDDPDANEYAADLFVSLAAKCKAVICCRVSPIQKAQVVQAVKQRVENITLAIGDGANDVSMIQTAHVGVGISGMEGLQAARASDYSISQFRFLKRLLLVHGRWSYRRIAKLVIFAFYKNMSLYMTQFWFCFHNMFSGQSLYDSWALAMYNLAFTAFPIMALAVFDRDTEADRILTLDQFPELFQDGMRNRLFNTAQFWKYTINALFHSLLLFYLPMLTASQLEEPDSGRSLGLPGHGIVAYTAVLVVVTLKCGLETHTWTIINVGMSVASIYFWFLFLIVYCVLFEYIPDFEDPALWYGADTRVLSHGVFWLVFICVTVISLLRDICWKVYRRNYNPTLVHCVQTFASSEQAFTRFDVRRTAPWLFPKHEVKAFKPSLSEGVGHFRFLASADLGSGNAEAFSTSQVFIPHPEASPGRRRQKISDIIEEDL
jgi:phospholipid-translocating P-type ATPase (flippase)